MTKPFLRSVLAGIAAAGVAVSPATGQTPPTSTPPVVQQVAFKVMPAPAKPAEKVVAKVLDVADLVCPPKDSPLAKPDSIAMKAAAKAYTEARAEQLMKTIRSTVERDSWDDAGGTGTLDFNEAGAFLVVRNCPATVARTVECVEAMRKVADPQVFVEMQILSVRSDHPAVAKLFGKKREAQLTTAELADLTRELKADGAVEVLNRPQLLLTDRQTGFFQVGQQFPRLVNAPPVEKGGPVQQVEYINTGTVVRMTPGALGDGKPTRLRLEVSIIEPSPSLIDLGNGTKARPIDCQSVEMTVEVPDGGTMAVSCGTKKVERRVESKVPILCDIPYLNRLFRNVGVSHERRDTIVVFTATRVKTEEQLRKLIERKAADVRWSLATPAVAPPMLPPAPVTMPRPVAIPAPPVGRLVPPPMPVAPLPQAVPTEASRWVVRPMPIPLTTRAVGPDGLERIGIDFDFNAKPTATAVLAPVADPLMTAYKAACAAGRKDEAARLALQLLAKDPTCFGRDK